MKKSKIKLILEDHWSGFLKLYNKKIRKNVKDEVNKVLRCKDIKHGYIEFKCDECNVSKKVGFTCNIPKIYFLYFAVFREIILINKNK